MLVALILVMSFAGISNSGFKMVRDGTVFDIADAARSALSDFLAGEGWSCEDLQAWLSGPYARAVGYHDGHDAISTCCRLASDVGGDIAATRKRVLDLIDRGLAARDCCTAHRALETRSVVGVQDHLGSIGYSPAVRSEASLFDCVASLLLSDMLTRPRDYQSSRCEECGDVACTWLHACQPCESRLCESGIVDRDNGPSDVSSSRPALRPSADPTVTGCVKVRVG